MRGGQLTGDDRSVSEILGTVLVFSLVILMALLLVGVGYQLFDEAADDFDDRLGQDTMQEIDDRLSAADAGTELAIPHGVGGQIDAFPDEGTVTIEVETDDADGNLEGADLASGSLTAEEEFPIGTLTHQTTGGVETVYQGGLLFEREGDRIQIISEPGFDYNGGSIDFSFVDVSDIDRLGGGDTLFAQRDAEASQERADAIERMVNEQRTIGSDVENPVATATVRVAVTIETDHPEAWRTYAEERMTREPKNVELGEDYVEFWFHPFEGTDVDPPEFDGDVLYSGLGETAHLFYDETLDGSIAALEEGELGDGHHGFTVSDTEEGEAASITDNEYGIAAVDEEDDEWVIYDPDDEWIDVSGEEVGAPDHFSEEDSDLGGEEDHWVWDSEQAVVCVVWTGGEIATEEVKEVVAEGNCAGTIVGEDDPPEPEPELEVGIEELDPDDGQVAVGDESRNEPTFTVEVDNVGDGFANEAFVALAADLDGDGLEVVDYEAVSLYPFEEPVELALSFVVDSAFNDDENAVVFTQHHQDDRALEFVDQPVFEIQDVTGDEGATAGGTVELEATITNTGERDEQVVALRDSDGRVVDTEELELGIDETGAVDLSWDVPPGIDLGDGEELTVETRDDEETVEVGQKPVALITDVDVADEADPVDPDDDTVTIEVTVGNPSDERLEDAEVRVDTDDTDLLDPDQDVSGTVTIEEGDSEATVALDAELADSPITDWVTVETDDDSAEEVGIVERDGPDCSEVEYAVSGGMYEIGNVDELQCLGENGLHEDYRVVDDVAAHGTQFWNGGDGFEPIGEGGHHYAPQDPSRCDVPCEWDGQLFSGTFDGDGHLIEGLYIERPDERFVGLFGSTNYPHLEDESGNENIAVGYGSTIQNVLLADVYVHGKQHVGALAGQAGGEVIQSRSEGTVIAEQQLVGGLVGDAAHGDVDNELVAEGTVVGGDNPDGVLGEGIGGLVGRTHWGSTLSTAYTQDIDVVYDGTTPPPEDEYPNTGGILGASSYVDSEFRQMYTNVSVPTDDGGAVVGTILQQSGEDGDYFADSVYWDSTEETDGYGGQDGFGVVPSPTLNWNERVTEEMKGPTVLPDDEDEEFYDQFPGVTRADTAGTMDNLDWEIWTPVYEIDEDGEIADEDLPIFQWEVDVQDRVEVEITGADPAVTPGALGEDGELEVTVTVSNTGDENQEQTILLQDPNGVVVDTHTEEWEGDSEAEITLTWETSTGDEVDEETDGQVIVRSEDAADTEAIELKPLPDEAVTVEIEEVDETVEAVNEELEVDVTVSAEDGVLDGTELALRADGTLVAIYDGLGGTNYQATLTWVPTVGDVGSVDLEVQVLGTEETDNDATTVLSPVEPFTPSDDPPVDADIDLITTD